MIFLRVAAVRSISPNHRFSRLLRMQQVLLAKYTFFSYRLIVKLCSIVFSDSVIRWNGQIDINKDEFPKNLQFSITIKCFIEILNSFPRLRANPLHFLFFSAETSIQPTHRSPRLAHLALCLPRGPQKQVGTDRPWSRSLPGSHRPSSRYSQSHSGPRSSRKRF